VVLELQLAESMIGHMPPGHFDGSVAGWVELQAVWLGSIRPAVLGMQFLGHGAIDPLPLGPLANGSQFAGHGILLAPVIGVHVAFDAQG
jgi:hypothetical protein